MDSLHKIDQDRIKAIEALPKTDERKKIRYKDKDNIYPVVEVPLELLIYNAHNGRIKSLTLSYESQHKELDSRIEADKLVIEQFLFDSARARNERTIESIEKIGQQEFGIITKDGVIIDGNRRAMLLGIINKRTKSNHKFKAVVLEDTLRENKKEIITLETSYQMGVDSKVDYNPIEKYIRCKELQEYYSVEEISLQMAESPSRIQEYLDILSLMEDYLIYLGTPETYTRLEKREGHFVDLFKYLKAYNGVKHQSVDWEYTCDDVLNLKYSYFDYIRLGVPVARARVLARPAKSNSFFTREEIWKDFSTEHKKTLDMVKESVPLVKLKSEFPQESISTLVDMIDEKWKSEILNSMDGNLYYFEGLLADVQTKLTPVRLLAKAKSTLCQIKREVLREQMNESTRTLIGDIDLIIKSFKELT